MLGCYISSLVLFCRIEQQWSVSSLLAAWLWWPSPSNHLHSQKSQSHHESNGPCPFKPHILIAYPGSISFLLSQFLERLGKSWKILISEAQNLNDTIYS